jgi:hypothetical protein
VRERGREREREIENYHLTEYFFLVIFFPNRKTEFTMTDDPKSVNVANDDDGGKGNVVIEDTVVLMSEENKNKKSF